MAFHRKEAQLKRSLGALGLVLFGSLTLTACDPPMPPEVLASIAEQTYTCEAGDSELYALPTVASIAADWQFSVEMYCPGMTITPVDAATAATALQINRAGVAAIGTTFSEVPFALDAVVLAVNLPDITNVALSVEAIEKIWAGQITNWNDPTLVSLNTSFELPDLAISFGTDAEVGDTTSFTDWMNRLSGKAVSMAGGTANLEEFVEGSLVLTKYSRAADLTATVVAIVTDPKQDAVAADAEHIISAGTMFKSKLVGTNVQLTFDAKAKPIAPEGISQAPAPYEAVTLITLSLVGEDNLKTRAAAKYLLRQDSQGSLGLSSVIALPENLRAIALSTVSVGLPLPTIAPE
jgi:phosphate transport system substrate-binding protein